MMENDTPQSVPAAQEEAPLLVNVTHMTRDKYFEAVRAGMRRGRSLWYSLGGIVVAVIGLLMGSPIAAALGFGAAVLAIASPAVIGWRDYQKLCAVHPGGEWDKTVRFYRDRVETDSGGGRVTAAPYKSIRRERETERMYILDFGRTRPATTFEKSGFILGSMEELRSFLTEARLRTYDEPEQDNDVD